MGSEDLTTACGVDAASTSTRQGPLFDRSRHLELTRRWCFRWAVDVLAKLPQGPAVKAGDEGKRPEKCAPIAAINGRSGV
jgi:hypothetical protein